MDDFTPPERSAAPASLRSDHPGEGSHRSAGGFTSSDSLAQARFRVLESLATPPAVTWVEWDHLRFRVVAMEQLLVALLADGPSTRLDRLRETSSHVAPRRGSTEHPLTLLAAAQIVHLVERARHIKKHPPK